MRPYSPPLAAAVLALLAGPAAAGPCAGEIHTFELELNARLDAAAARGKGAPQTTAAQLHRQPTPDSLAAAEASAGDISEQDLASIRKFMVDARKADDSGNLAACRKAIAEARDMGKM